MVSIQLIFIFKSFFSDRQWRGFVIKKFMLRTKKSMDIKKMNLIFSWKKKKKSQILKIVYGKHLSFFLIFLMFFDRLKQPKKKTSCLTTVVHIEFLKNWSENDDTNYFKLTFIVLNGKFVCNVNPVAQMIKSASTCFPPFI